MKQEIAMTTLSIVIPAYNEEDGVIEIINRVLSIEEELIGVGVNKMELIVVDDGSNDNTACIADGVEGVKLIRHTVNRGYGAALKTGFSQATGELIGFLDADGTYPPEYFSKLCAEALNGYDIVIGTRMSGEKSQMPYTRRVGNLFFAGLLSLLGRQKVTDSASGMRVFKRDVLDKIYPLPDGLNLTPVMSTRAVHEKIKLTEVPIPYSERVGPSKLSVVRDGSLFLQSMIWTVLTYNPVRILGMIGLGCLAVSGLVVLCIIIARLNGITYLGPWGVAALFTGLFSGLAGISIFSLGVTFNYLVSMFYKQPIRQGLFGRPIFSTPLDHHFGWVGILAIFVGFGIAFTSLALGVSGWEITRLWFYLLGSAMLIMVGVQLIISWILLRVLDELSKRDNHAERDLNGTECNIAE
jgi:glycosyltransferase involved in cell wall biosynthesis